MANGVQAALLSFCGADATALDKAGLIDVKNCPSH